MVLDEMKRETKKRNFIINLANLEYPTPPHPSSSFLDETLPNVVTYLIFLAPIFLTRDIFIRDLLNFFSCRATLCVPPHPNVGHPFRKTDASTEYLGLPCLAELDGGGGKSVFHELSVKQLKPSGLRTK